MEQVAEPSSRGRWASMARLGAVWLCMTWGVASVAVALDTTVPTTYAAVGPVGLVADLGAGLAMLVVGATTWWFRQASTVGLLWCLLGATWLAADWVGWVDGPPVARSFALVLAPFLLPVLAHVALTAHPRPVARGRVPRTLAFAYGVTAVFSIARATLRNPFLDPDCWSNCEDNNVFLVRAQPELVSAMEMLWLGGSVAAGLMVAGACVWRLAHASRPQRRLLRPVLSVAVAAATAHASYSLLLLTVRPENPENQWFSAVFLLRGFTLAALAVAAAWTLARDLSIRRAITRLAVDLAQAPRAGTLEADLAAALEDPDVEVAYWAPGTRRYLNGDGREVQPRALDGRSATPIVRHGEPVAVVVHSRSTVTADLEAVLGAATRLAVDNERLRAEILAQVEDLRASRARIVEAGDHARRSLERNLHDGAQQRLLALCYELRLARDQADRDSGRLAMLTLSCDEGQAALASLRELAHGIYPVVLADAGLGPALLSLAEDPEVPVPVELVGTVDRRFPEPVERAVYLFIVEAIDHVASTGSDHVEVSLVCDDDRVRVMVGPTSAMPGAEMSDRIGALGGTVDLHHGVLRAEVQCG